MSANVQTVAGAGSAAPIAPLPADPAAAEAEPSQHPVRAPSVKVDTVPASPPADVVQEMRDAARAADELARQERELHFERDPSSGKLIVQVRDLDGNVLRTVPPSAVLDLAAGKPLEEN